MPLVTTPSGSLRGVALEGADAYLGIRYAEPPVRFQPPEAARPWDGVRDATEFGPSAPQPVGGRFSGLVPGMGVREQSEDCQSLNVWAPHDAEGLPVMVWLHGGAFTIGGSSLPTYDGRLLATEQRVVVVSLNYRLGALGWLSGPDGVTPNCGLLDQLLALQWVRDHVSAFGGDPGNVTVFGESAGAGSVVHLLASPLAKGLVHKAIAQSPGAGQTLTRHNAGVVSTALVEALEGADLATVPLEQLLEAQQLVADRLVMRVGAMAFHPTVDGSTVPKAPLDEGALLDVPLLAGTTSEEMRLFADPVFSTFDLGTLAAVMEPLLSAEAHRPLGADAVAAAVAAYGEVHADSRDVFAALASDQVMRLPLADLLDLHGGPAYAYDFTWRAAGDVGACHAVDLPFTFGTLDREGWGAWVGDPDDAEGLSRAVREAWATFARTGAPAAKGLPTWPPYDANRLTMALGRTVEVVPDPLAAARRRCAALRPSDRQGASGLASQ
jgi:para-nitrobenzyl esterase